MNEALVQGVDFNHRNRKSITRHKNAGSCALPLDLKGNDGYLNCKEWEHSKL